MSPAEPFLLQAARWLTFGSAVAILFSIAASQTLLALAVAALLLSGAKLRWPPVRWPLGLFLLGTLISLAFSAEPAAGLPQVRKIFVYLMLLVVFSTLREVVLLRRLFLCWAGAGALIALRGYVQFAAKLHQAQVLGSRSYEYQVSERITGFMSHWMTFSGQEMFALLMLAAFVLFASDAQKRLWLWLLCLALIGIALLLGMTRSVWIASGVAGMYLVWCWRRWLILALPAIVLLGVVASPDSVRERFSSILQPRKGTDSNEHRLVTWKTGLNIIRHHPLLGLGPEGVKLHFAEYVPADVARPLPVGWYGHLHNIYLHYAAERGIPTMLALLWLLLKILRDFWRQLNVLPLGRGDARFLLQGGIAVVVATMVAGIFELNLGDSEVLAMFLTVVAAGYVAIDSAEDRLA